MSYVVPRRSTTAIFEYVMLTATKSFTFAAFTSSSGRWMYGCAAWSDLQRVTASPSAVVPCASVAQTPFGGGGGGPSLSPSPPPPGVDGSDDPGALPAGDALEPSPEEQAATKSTHA